MTTERRKSPLLADTADALILKLIAENHQLRAQLALAEARALLAKVKTEG